MELMRVLPSAEDEVNVACFHPSAGGGLVYGTKVCFELEIDQRHFHFPVPKSLSIRGYIKLHFLTELCIQIIQEGKLRVLQYETPYGKYSSKPQ